MKVAIFISEIIWTSHLGTGLEILQREIDNKDELYAFVCNGFLERCDQNLEAQESVCTICVNKRKKGFSLLSEKVNLIPIQFEKRDFKYFDAKTDLKSFLKIKHKEFDLGLAVASSLISRKRDSNISIEENFEYFKSITNNAASLYDFFIAELEKIKPEKVYIFNGRFDYDRALLRACETLKIDYTIFDGAGPLDKFMLIKNAMIHDIDKFHDRVFDVWNESTLNEEEKKKIGEGFYQERRYGSDKARYYFVENQKAGILPDSWDSSKINVTVFLSSEDEFVAIGEQWKMDLYDSQLDGLRKIANSLKQKNDSVKLYIRIHPNTFNTSPEFVKEIFDLESDYIEVIPPDSLISSYSLLLSSSKIITFGSTMGIEAAFWGIPSINLGKCLFMHMGVSYTCKNHEELMEMLFAEHLKPIHTDNVYKYGFYQMNFGIDYKYFESINNEVGIYRGYNLHKLNQTKYTRFKEELKKYLPNGLMSFCRKMRSVNSNASAIW